MRTLDVPLGLLMPPLLREHRPSSSSSPEGADNPFAPPPEGSPDQPWQPRGPHGGNSGPDSDGDGDGNGNGDRGPSPQPQGPAGQWGSQWSSRQPGRQNGGFGTGPGDARRENDGNEQGGGPGGLRWDPTDPLQRRARYALLAGMWGFFFSLFSLPEIALLLGALALYWGISSLRGKPVPPLAGATSDDVGTSTTPGSRPAPGPSPASRPQTSAAVSGLITGTIALAIVAATFTFQIVYRDYYTCVDDALTTASRHSCEDLLPKELRPLLGARD
jgi:hypothetical protein